MSQNNFKGVYFANVIQEEPQKSKQDISTKEKRKVMDLSVKEKSQKSINSIDNNENENENDNEKSQKSIKPEKSQKSIKSNKDLNDQENQDTSEEIQQDWLQKHPQAQKDDNNMDYYSGKVQANKNQSPTRKQNDKTFLTLQKKEDESPMVWKPYDYIFPAGRLAKLVIGGEKIKRMILNLSWEHDSYINVIQVKIMDVNAKNFPFSEITNKLKLNDGFPVVNLIGSGKSERGKFYAGVARACFNSDAIIVDSGIETGLEQYAIRRDLRLIGVAPENCAKYPKINPTSIDPYEISNGHSHIFLINDKEKTLEWSQETLFKIQLVLKYFYLWRKYEIELAEGKVSRKVPRCKIVNLLLADSPYYIDEVRLAVKYDLPIIVVKGSPVCDEIIKFSQSKEDAQWNLVDQGQICFFFEQIQLTIYPHNNKEMEELLQKGHFYMLNSIDSEEIAQYIHLLLSFTPY